MSPGDNKMILEVEVKAVEAYNFTRFRLPGVSFHPKCTQIGFRVSAEGKRVYHAGDTDFIPEIWELKSVDVALFPIMGRATMDLDEAVEATLALHPKIAIPMHCRGASAEKFKDKIEAKSDITVLVISEGEVIDP
jgi:L-ascorbate metabolism protein UlaG (beta-lactamase superfamily)